ncbi:MAG: PmoA family protein [Planctomycetes bacterium]|nr:PmoA family protein [Planctomycetota bacterium]
MIRRLVAFVVLLAVVRRPAAADLAIDHRDDRLAITTEAGDPVADYVFADPAIGRPSLRDLRTPAGVVVTRPCPPRPGIDPPDHPTMHPGLMLCFSDLSGHDPWRHKAAVRFMGFEGRPAVRDGAASFTASVDYLGAAADTPAAPVICRERSTITIADGRACDQVVRVVTWDAELTAGDAGVTFADVQEMGFGIRLAKELSPKGGGRYLASHGGRDEKGVFGRQGEWCDATGTVAGTRCGVTVINGPGNPRQPFFHARDSGWLLANHFGTRTYAQGEPGAITLAPRGKLRLSMRFVLHGDVADERIEGLAAMAAPAARDGASSALIAPATLAAYAAEFNRLDPEDVVNAVPNAEAAAWLQANVPRFDCPDADLVQLWHFRWWCLRKHLRRDESGRWVFTEFITRPQPVSSALGHHLMEGRWLRDPQFIDQAVDYWLDAPQRERLHKYSQWLPHAVWQRALVTGDFAFASDRLDALTADHRQWAAERGRPDGLFWQYDVRDAMEESISGGRQAKNIRPTLNSYMAGSALALAAIARHGGRIAEAEAFATEGETLRDKLLATLWNPQDEFFEVVREDGSFADVREAIGFIPWYFSLPPAGQGYEAAWRQIRDDRGFRAPFGITTAERRHPAFRSHGVGTCEWDGAVWPFATSQTLTALANLLRGPPQDAVTKADYLDALLTYVRCHRYDGEIYLGEYLDETTGAWLKGRDPRSRWYNHSTFADLVIAGLVGLVPRDDDVLEIHPLLPGDAWDWFCLEGVRYHGHDLTIIWDRDGTQYGREAGLSAWVDGRRVLHAPTLAPVSGPLE